MGLHIKSSAVHNDAVASNIQKLCEQLQRMSVSLLKVSYTWYPWAPSQRMILRKCKDQQISTQALLKMCNDKYSSFRHNLTMLHCSFLALERNCTYCALNHRQV